ncbi:MAG: hypothetical protein DHS20C20_18070 [Ardenticatenaceae bacterium]|nr:MAG: hypothetical protein DHS20C20_18070 [Ardenticatenaceae bacterium]
MPNEARPLLSVIVRRFPQKLEHDIEQLVGKIQRAVANQPGFVGLQSSFSHEDSYCELVTVFAFDTEGNLERWKNSPIREGFARELDKHSQDSVTYAQFGNLALLLQPKAQLSKIETVVILIFWVLFLGELLRYLASFLMPGIFATFWQNVLLVSVNVMLISYVFLPWSSIIVTRLKATVSRGVKKK